MIERPTTEQLKQKAFRDAFINRAVRESVAAQVRALRQQHGLSRLAFAQRVGIHGMTVFRLERPSLNGFTRTDTLLRIASAFDVALMIKFVAWSRFMVETFVLLPNGMLEYLTEHIDREKDAELLTEWAADQA